MTPSCISFFALALLPVCIGAFVTPSTNRGWARSAERRPWTTQLKSAPSGLHLSSSITSSDALSSMLISTIDSDIAKLSDNEFAPVFLGGVMVMLGGLLSAIFVGTIVNKKDLYASIVAESYLQGADDEEFWRNMSEEEKRKAQALMQKMKDNDNRHAATPIKETPEKVAPVDTVATVAKPATPTGETAEEVNMFSDY